MTGKRLYTLEFVVIRAMTTTGIPLLGSYVVPLWAWLTFRRWEAAERH